MSKKKSRKNENILKDSNEKYNLDDICLFVLETLVVSHGNLHGTYHDLKPLVLTVIKNSDYSIEIKKHLMDNLSDFLGVIFLFFQKHQKSINKKNGNYKNLIIQHSKEQLFWLHVLHENQTVGLEKTVFKYNFYGHLFFNIFVFSLLFVLYLVPDLDINFTNVFFALFFFLSIKLCWLHKSIKFYLLVIPFYLGIKAIVITLNEMGAIFFPYEKYFDLNIFSATICLYFIFAFIPFLYDFLSNIKISHSLYKLYFYKKYKNQSREVLLSMYLNDDYLIKASNYQLKEKFNAMIENESKNKGFKFNLSYGLFTKPFLLFGFCISISYLFFLTLGPVQRDYFFENNGYCKFIGNHNKISNLHKDSSIVYMNSKESLNDIDNKFNDVYDYKENTIKIVDRFYWKIGLSSKKRYIQEVFCHRNIIDPKDVQNDKIKNTQ